MFDPTKLTDAELSRCLDEARRRGAALAVYDVDEILTMTDGWDNQQPREVLKRWFDRESLEETMCGAARERISDFLNNPDE